MRIQYCLLLFLLLLGFTQCKSPAAKEDRLSDDASRKSLSRKKSRENFMKNKWK